MSCAFIASFISPISLSYISKFMVFYSFLFLGYQYIIIMDFQVLNKSSSATSDWMELRYALSTRPPDVTKVR